MDTGSILGWLEWILKRMLVLFHSLIPNWGVAILILTIVIKVVLYPFTHKSYQSTSKMQALAPKINELKAKYKDNPTKMNQEMANIYKSEGVNPLGGCLPLLLQMPIFIALYGLLNKHFDLRGAVFIPGWITDLSGPETIFTLPFSIPFLGSDIHLLPILFALTMVISTKTMQSPGAAGQQGSMKMMMYFMPLFLFFVLYSAPSGLLIYWIMTNVLTMFQQKATSKHRAKMAEEGDGDSTTSAQRRSKIKHPQAVSASVSKNTGKKSAAQKGKGGGAARKKKKK
jgi:YidC/Oxa1 family membrane protein insertase